MQESTCGLHVTRDIKQGPVVQDTISDRHEYANLTCIRFGMLLYKHAAECEVEMYIENPYVLGILLGCGRVSDHYSHTHTLHVHCRALTPI